MPPSGPPTPGSAPQPPSAGGSPPGQAYGGVPGAPAGGYGAAPGGPVAGGYGAAPGGPVAGGPVAGGPVAGGYGAVPGGPPGTPPPTGAYGTPATPPAGGGGPHNTSGGGGKPKSKVPLIAGGSVGALAVVGGIVWGVSAMGGGAPLPMSKGMLPKDTTMVARMKIDIAQVGGEDLPEEARWSRLASRYCGGDDVFSDLLNADREYARKEVARMLSSDDARDDLQTALKCGKELAGAFPFGGSSYRIKVGEHDDKDAYSLSFVEMKVDEMPDATDRRRGASDPDNMQHAFCRLTRYDEKKKCDDESFIFAKLDETNLWLEGAQKALDQFGEDVDLEGGHTSNDLDLLEDLAREFSGYDEAIVTIDVDRDFRDPLASHLGGRYLKKADKETLEDLQETADELREDMEDIKGYGFGTKGDFGHGQTAEVYLVVYADDDSTAEKIKKEYDDFLGELGNAIEEGFENFEDEDEEKSDEKLSARQKDRKRLREKITKAQIEASVAALKELKAEVSGDKVTISLELAPDDRLKEDIAAYTKETMEVAKAAATLVDNLAAGDELDAEALDTVGGDDLKDSIDDYKAVAEVCEDACESCDDDEKCTTSCASRYLSLMDRCDEEVEKLVSCIGKDEDKACNDEGNRLRLPFDRCKDERDAFFACEKKTLEDKKKD